MIDIEGIVEAISAAATLDELRALFPDLAEALGVAHLVYHAINVPSSHDASRPVFLLTYGDDWVSRYFSERYLEIDPIVSYGRRAHLHLDWSDVVIPKGRVTDFFRDAERHGIGRYGLTIPVRAPGERALFTVNARSSQRDWDATRARLMTQIHILAHFIHERAMRLSAMRQDALPALSHRELECLQGTAAGRQQKAIAWQLGISESAVNLYLKTARTKLGAATLAQAVAMALSLDIIDYTRRPPA